MNCPRCGSKIEKGWAYCPKCGTHFRREMFGDFFNIGKIFERFDKMQKEMSKSVEKDFEVFDLTPMFRPMTGKASGFTIKITRAGDNEPKVSVQTFGDVDKRMVNSEVRELTEHTGVKLKTVRPREHAHEESLPIPKYTEEPKATVRRLESKFLVEIEVPGVKSEKDVRITELENSVEVRAMAGDKAYFKILTKPEQVRITKKKLEKGKLVIEFS